jgi:hypothetical protein
MRFRLAADASKRPLLTGGRCSQGVVKSSLTLLIFGIFKISNSEFFFFRDRCPIHNDGHQHNGRPDCVDWVQSRLQSSSMQLT